VKAVIIGLMAIVCLAFVFYQKPSVVNPMDAGPKAARSNMVNSNSANNSQVSNQSSATNIPKSNESKKSLTGNTHLDQLSPEMKDALRKKLLFNAPIETIERPDGSVIMKTNGRVTHMPVAVQMPDGTIKIKEYSYIPEDK
jgi:hypothetical protein